MSTDFQHSWTSFYMEFADRLLAFKDDRQALMATLRGVYADLGERRPNLSSTGDSDDTDPFTVLTLFNRVRQGVETRRNILQAMSSAFHLASPVPKDFAGVPVMANRRLIFHAALNGSRQQEDKIGMLWHLFENALAYANNPTTSNKGKVASGYDAIRRLGMTWKVTTGLYWARPFSYLSLDATVRDFLAMQRTLPAPYRGLLKAIGSLPTASEYLDLGEYLQETMTSDNGLYSTFPELCGYAWTMSEQVSDQRKGIEREKEKATQAAALGDADVETTRYWLYAPGEGARMWEEFYERGVMGLAWGELGDLSAYATKEEMRQRLLETRDENTSQTNSARAVWQFSHEIQPGDVIFVKRGRSEILGRGTVTGEYVYDPDGGHYPHLRTVAWDRKGTWRSDQQFVMKTLTEVTDYPDSVARIGAFFEETEDEAEAGDTPLRYPEYAKENFLDEVYMDESQYDALVGILRAKKNVILQGAPGVGKTYAAKRLAYSMMGAKDASRVMMVQFHQSYSYEDFIEGYRPCATGFELVKGAFYSFCKKAAEDEDNDYFFIIDEINRGNLSKIFGELFMLIESDKRGNKLQLLYSRELFDVPPNVYIVGMMNTADRSLAMLDYALRRRFAFVELRPAFDSEGFTEYRASLNNPRFDALVSAVEHLNETIAADESLGEGFRIGHSYLCNMDEEGCDSAALASIVEYELIPMLAEYWFDEPSKVRQWSNTLRGSLR